MTKTGWGGTMGAMLGGVAIKHLFDGWYLKGDLDNHKWLVKERYRTGFAMLSKCKGPGIAMYLH